MVLRLAARLRAAGRDLLVAWYAWRDPALTWRGRLLLLGTAAYVLSPVDVCPDWIPLLGWMDDLVVIGVVLPQLLRWLPPNVLRQAQRRAGIVHAD